MSETEVSIREARNSDRDAIRKVLLDAYQQYESVLAPERWAAYREDILASVEAEGPRARLVADRNGEIVGSALLFDSSLAAYGRDIGIESPIVRLLAVSPGARGQGIATALLRESARRALEWGADTLHLHTSDMMASAVRLYERLGFERAFDKEFYNGERLVKSYRLRLRESALLEARA
ncbi:GNAT family N-acetyltransferase [Cohnella sp. CFH 77786]|uniref:GNAT family N-acetyltransferase n=1 Tax=Cohnella sp. CFH 77786 TaxID=2662265 RepID=UPI001C60E998|nr:GNAT family N-acetyltransferase [Cohnella sp. CFH 77786]MBW5449271.1 GNAT family N-acetyltransferase [Cohnella sp. CFH 77786]